MADMPQTLVGPDSEDIAEGSTSSRVSSVNAVTRPREGSGEFSRVPATPDEERTEFLELVLHDLQSSVAVLDISTRLLVEDMADADPGSRSTVSDIQRATIRVQQYIDHLVTSERLSSGRLSLRRENVELVPLLGALVDDYAHHARSSSASVELDVGRSSKIGLCADAILLRRVFQNLLENALRHVGRGGRVLIQAQAESVIEVRVCNDGPRIPKATRDRIFDKFSASSNELGAAGLGLYFCRAAVAAHGGTIAIEDNPAWPTCFVVRLPTAAI